MSGLSSQSLGTVWGRSLHSGLVAQIPHRGRDIFLELDSTHDVDLGQPAAARGLYLTVASVPTASSPMSSTMTKTSSERRIRVMALVTVSSTRWRRTSTPSDSRLNQSTCSPGRNVLQWPAGPHTIRFSRQYPFQGAQRLLGGGRDGLGLTRLADTGAGGLCRLIESVFVLDGADHTEGPVASVPVVDPLDPVADGAPAAARTGHKYWS